MPDLALRDNAQVLWWRLKDACQLLPWQWRRHFIQPDPYYRLELLPDSVALYSVMHGKDRLVDQSSATSPVDATAIPALTPAMRSNLADDPLVALFLPSELCLTQMVSMPKASGRALRAALAFEIERLNPLPPEQVYFDFAVVRRSALNLELSVRIVEREVIDSALGWCRASGLSVGALGIVGDVGEMDPHAFQLEGRAVVQLFWRRRRVPALAVLALALSVSVACATYARGERVQYSLDEELSRARTQVSAVSRLRAETNRLERDTLALSGEKRQAFAAETLANLARVLPDGTWLSDVDMTGPKIRIQGYSDAAANLIAILDHSHLFGSAGFAAPVSQEAPGKPERFDIALQASP